MKWLYGLLGLLFLILFHETGHFLAALFLGVKVETFSIGFGPILLHKNIKGIDFRLSLLPLGGYCGMKGEKDFQKAIEENLPEISCEKDSLYGTHPIKRALIGFAGPFCNFLLSVIFFSLISGIGYSYFTYSNKIILAPELYENSSHAALDAGIQTGDIIKKIDKIDINNFSDIVNYISLKADQDVTVQVQRDSKTLDFIVHIELDKENGIGKIGLAADTSSLNEIIVEPLSFFNAIGKGFSETFDYIILSFKSVKLLFKGIELKNSVSGPVRVTDLLGSTISEGFSSSKKDGFIMLFNMLGIISISLCIMNLLPIPILDGGLILLSIIEFITHKKIKPKVQYYIQFIGLGLILVLFVIGCIGDIAYFFGK